MPLAYGDYQITDDIIFERKSYNDFVSSILDGRIFKQCNDMRDEVVQPVIILEGGARFGKQGQRPYINENSYHGALLSVVLGYGIPIVPTRNVSETANIIRLAAERANRDTNKPIRTNTRKKPKTIPEQRQFIFEAFPGVGPKLAKDLAAMPYSLISILKAIDQCQVDKFGPKKKKVIQDILRWSP